MRLWAGWWVLVVGAGSCLGGGGHGRLGRGPGASLPRHEVRSAETAPWLIVNPEALARLGKEPVGGVCMGGTPPKRLTSPALKLPAGHPLRKTGYTFIVHATIDRGGAIVKAQILVGPDTPDVRQAIVSNLAQWRFAPAGVDGKPAAVHFILSLVVPSDGRSGGPGGQGGH